MQRFLTATGDMVEGIRAKIIDKDKRPQWNPPSLDQVTDVLVDHFFESLGEYDLKLEK